MKNVLFALIVLLAASCSQAPKYSVHVNMDGLSEGTAYLQKREKNEFVKVDSAIIEDGNFVFTGSVDLPEMYFISFKDKPGRIDFFIENADIQINATLEDLKNTEITGSASQDEFTSFVDGKSELSKKSEELVNLYQQAYASGDTLALQQIIEDYKSLNKQMEEYDMLFINDHKTSALAALLCTMKMYEWSGDQIDSVIQTFDPSIAQSAYIQEMKERADKLKNVAIGKAAPDFTMNDPEGNPVRLSEHFGKNEYILLDFWASWCTPCRKENPNVVAIFNDYKDKGFNVFGVSLDRPDGMSQWLQAIENDELTWTHVSDLKFWGNEAAQLYAVSSIPANFLLDKEGKIIAKDLRGEDLRTKLAELLDQ